MDLNIELVDGYEGIEIGKLTITEGDKELLRLGTIVGNLALEEILNLGKYNGSQLTLTLR